jgi:alpha-beta hydrolase superfamily lysophospholipase
VRRGRVVLAIAVAVLACAGAASAVLAATRATGPRTQELTITASDGTKLACALVLPGGSPPTGGWPGVLLFHALGQDHRVMEAMASLALAPAGFASLACDARGTSASGGTFGLSGPKEAQDARDQFAWLAGRSDVSDTEIGAVGLSLGGGEVWNAAVAGVPFKAIVPAISWTSLGSALNPGGVVKRLEITSLQMPEERWDDAFANPYDDLIHGDVTARVKALETARSWRSQLPSLTVPTLLLQGRHDFLFDLDQALAAYRLLAGPKRLYLGDLGHPPAANPAAEQPTYLAQVVGWLKEYLAGGPKLGGGVVLAHDPWDGRTTSYNALPRTRHSSVNLPGRSKLELGKTKSYSPRSVRLPGGPLETFGDGSVTVRYSGASDWSVLTATISVKGQSTPVTIGAAPVTKAAGVLRIPLMDESVLLPRRKKLVVTLGVTSPGGVFYPNVPYGATITLGRVTLNLSLLRRTVSR